MLFQLLPALLAVSSVSGLVVSESASSEKTLKSFWARSDTVLANGSSFVSSSKPLSNGLSWQASGFLQQGGCTNGKQFITNCYEMRLSSDTTQNLQPLMDTPRQRVEFLTSHQPDGAKWHYSWRSYVPSYVTGSSTFFHLMQIFSTADAGPVFFMDIIKKNVQIKDVRANTIVASVPLSSFEDTPLMHSMTVTYGPTGNISYTVTNSQTGKIILGFSKSGYVGTNGTYLKFGAYRNVYSGMSDVKAWYGDFVQTKM